MKRTVDVEYGKWTVDFHLLGFSVATGSPLSSKADEKRIQSTYLFPNGISVANAVSLAISV